MARPAVLGPHIWRVGRVYDPEGILSTVPAIATTLFGVLAGRLDPRAGSADGRHRDRALRRREGWESASASPGSRWLPINKALWTGSYAVFTAGAALMALAAGYWLIEMRGSRWWTRPFEMLGVNALAVFFLSTLLAQLLISIRIAGRRWSIAAAPGRALRRLFRPLGGAAIASLAWAVANVLLWLAIMWPLFRRGIRLTV